MQFYVKTAPDQGEKKMELAGPILTEVIPWASAEYSSFPSGNMLQQSYLNPFTGFHKYLADLSDGTTVYPACIQPTIAMQFMLSGHASCQMKGGKRAALLERRVCLFYLSKGRNRGIISPGRFHSIHFELNPIFLKDAGSGMSSTDRIIQLVDTSYPSGVQFGSVHINYIMRNRLNRLASLKPDNLEADLKQIVTQLIHCYKDGIRDNDFLQSINTNDEANKLINIRKRYIIGAQCPAAYRTILVTET